MALSDLIEQVNKNESGSASRKPSMSPKQILEDIGSIGIRGVNTMALGLPELITNKVAPDFSKEMFAPPVSGIGQGVDLATQIAAFAGGGAGQIGTRVGTGIAKKLGGGVVANAVGGTVGGGLAGGAQINQESKTPKEFAVNQSMQALGGSLFGLSVGVLAPTLKAVANMRNIKGPRAVKISQDIRNEFFNVKAKAIQKFGSQLDDIASKNPTRKVPLTDFVNDFEANLNDLTAEARNLIKKTPQLKKAIAGEADELTVSEVQKAINYLGKKVPQKPGTIRNEVLDAINDLKASQLESFPEMEGIRAEYKGVIEPFNNVKNYFRFNKIMNSIKGGFGGAEGEAAIKSLLSENTIKRIGGLEGALKLSSALGEFARNLTIGISSGVGAGIVFNKILKDRD